MSAERIVRFGVFEVDLRSGELHKQGLKIRLQEQPFEILVWCLTNRLTIEGLGVCSPHVDSSLSIAGF